MLTMTSKVLREPLLDWFQRSKRTKRSVADDLGTSRQSPTDWTSDKPKPVTPENAVRIAELANDNDLTLNIIYTFFGILRPVDGDVYRKDISSINELRELEEEERDQARLLVRRVLLKEVNKMTQNEMELVLRYAKEEAEVVFVTTQHLNALCDILGISMKDLFKMFMSDWQEAGYFGGN